MKIRIENRPLTEYEKRKLHENLQEVIHAYEYWTKRKFMRFDIASLERMIRVATPAQIIAVIKTYSKNEKYKDKFTYFGYIEEIVLKQFKNRRGGNKNHDRKR